MSADPPFIEPESHLHGVPRRRPRPRRSGRSIGWSSFGIFGFVMLCMVIYHNCRIDVGTGEMAVLIRKTGLDVNNTDEVAPSLRHKGPQARVLTEGRYFQNPFDEGPRFFNPYDWDWDVVPQTVIPQGKLGVRVALTGDDLDYGQFLGEVTADGTPIRKGIIPEILNPGRYAINPYLYQVEIHAPVTIQAGFRGVVTNLAGPIPDDPNQLLVSEGSRGVQETMLSEGTHYVNPYVRRVSKVDCRSQRFNLAQKKDMGFPSKDGFWVSLDGRIQFRVNPERASEVYVIYNESENGDAIDAEIIRKVIMPNARSFCRLEGSSKLGKEFIEGETRMAFEKNFQKAMVTACEPLGIQIQEVLITRIRPPDQIALPIRERENARLDEQKYQSQIKQQEVERTLAEQKALVTQKSALIDVERQIVRLVTEAQQAQDVAVTKANEGLEVAKLDLEAAKDKAEAILSRGEAAADVIGYENTADAAGWKRAVEAFDGDGLEYARFVLIQKLSPAYRRIMTNTADSPIMKMFESMAQPTQPPVRKPDERAVSTDPAVQTRPEATPVAASIK